jgi:hypothetical protein
MNHPDRWMDSDANHRVWYILPLLPVVNKGNILFAPSVVGAHVKKMGQTLNIPPPLTLLSSRPVCGTIFLIHMEQFGKHVC